MSSRPSVPLSVAVPEQPPSLCEPFPSVWPTILAMVVGSIASFGLRSLHLVSLISFGLPILITATIAYHGEKAARAAQADYRARKPGYDAAREEARGIIAQANQRGRAIWLPVIQWYETESYVCVTFFNGDHIHKVQYEKQCVRRRHGASSGIRFSDLSYESSGKNAGTLTSWGSAAILVAPDIPPEPEPEFSPEVQAAVAAIMRPVDQAGPGQNVSIETADVATCLRMLDALVDPTALNSQTVGQAGTVLKRLGEIVGDVPEITGAIELLAGLLSQAQSSRDILAIKDALDKMRRRIEEHAFNAAAAVEVSGIHADPRVHQ